jgi:hypothetical protein
MIWYSIVAEVRYKKKNTYCTNKKLLYNRRKIIEENLYYKNAFTNLQQMDPHTAETHEQL